jgi:hypothetical protein
MGKVATSFWLWGRIVVPLTKKGRKEGAGSGDENPKLCCNI